MLTYLDLYQILIEAEYRMKDVNLPADVRERSKETVDLCNQRLSMEGLTKKQLKKLAGV